MGRWQDRLCALCILPCSPIRLLLGAGPIASESAEARTGVRLLPAELSSTENAARRTFNQWQKRAHGSPHAVCWDRQAPEPSEPAAMGES